MNVLGLHFGHDGSICVVRDGNVVANVLRERQDRSKHALSVTQECLRLALGNAGLTAGEIDMVALTSTQKIDMIGALAPGLAIAPNPGSGPLPRVPADLARDIPGFDPAVPLQTWYIEALTAADTLVALHPADRTLTREFLALPRESLRVWGVPVDFPGDRLWPYPRGFDDLSETTGLDGGALREYGFHLPLTISLEGRAVPGAFVQHHVCHAASSFYRSPYAKAAVFTQDGHYSTPGLNAGGFFWGDGARLVPLAPHYAPMGFFYETVGQFLRLSALGAPGKLMGLAPYGEPRFFHRQFVGNDIDLQERGLPTAGHSWLVFALRRMLDEGVDLNGLGRPERMTDPVNADLAASAQLVFEENRLAAVRCLARMVERLALAPEGLCLSGGVALNCPANTRMAMEGPLAPLFIEPNCDDGGLATGAALYLTHHLLGLPRLPPAPGPHLPTGGAHEAHPFVSLASPSVNEMEAALRRWSGSVRWKTVPDRAHEAAEAIAAGKLVAWVQGPSEVGPRALGRRSLLADARSPDTWMRVNHAKGREPWRPFAPAVLESAADAWFEALPLPSPYMLFTGKVRGGNLPAVTHVNGTSRVQTVDDEDRPFADLLRALTSLTGIPVVLNTSLNGPGQPIVETPDDALSLYAGGLSDVLFLGPFRVERR